MSSGPSQRPTASAPPSDVLPKAKVTRRHGKRSLLDFDVSQDNACDNVEVSDSQPLFVSSAHVDPRYSAQPRGSSVCHSPSVYANLCADDQPLFSATAHHAPSDRHAHVFKGGSVVPPVRDFAPVTHVCTNVVSTVSAPIASTSAAPPYPLSATLAATGAVRRPPSLQYSASVGSEVSDLASHLDDQDDAASQASFGAEEPSGPGQGTCSFKDALLRLHQVCPSLAAPSQPQSDTSSSVTESILGVSPSEDSQSLALVESALVSKVVKDAWASARHSPVVPGPDSLTDFPRAFPCGKFLRPKSFDLAAGLGLGSLVTSSAVPDSSLPLSQEDLLLASPSPPKAVPIPERAAIDCEEMARRALVSCTMVDSFLGGLLASVGVPGSRPFQLHQNIDPQDVVDFALASSRVLRFTASSVARLHLNLVLARRDALLSASQSVRDSRTRTSLRHTPFSSTSLFSGQVQPVVRRLAEASRDLASCHPAVSAPSQPPASTQPGFSGRPYYQPAPSGPRARPFRGSSRRAPYSRRPPLPPQAPAKGSSRR